MTRKELAIEIYRLEERKQKHNISEREWVKRILNGIGCVKGFLKPELVVMYNRKLLEA